MAKRKRKTPEDFVPDVNEILDVVRRRFGVKYYEKREAPEKIHCPTPGYEENYVVIPTEWTGAHLIKRDEIVTKMIGTGFEHSEDMRRLAISLGLAEKINIPSLDDDPEKWDISVIPLPVLIWLTEVVFDDFLAAFFVPKVR